MVKSGSGSLTLASAQAYTGGTSVDSGTLILGVHNAIVGSLTIGSDGTVDLGQYDLAILSLEGSGFIYVEKTLTVSSNADYVFSGIIDGVPTALIVKSGSGKQSFTGFKLMWVTSW